MVFGRKSKASGATEKTSSTRGGYPWAGAPTAGACNLAFGDLVHNFPALLQGGEGCVHAETMLSALGGVAGLAAQQTLRDRIACGGAAEGLQLITLKDGRTLLFGDPLNEMLAPSSAERLATGLWPLAAGQVAALLSPTSVPPLGPLFQAVSQRVGTPKEGWPEVASEHRPHAAIAALLQQTWPGARTMPQQAYPAKPGPLGPAPVEWWGAITAHAAAALISQTAPVLNAATGLSILMQGAIYGSKLDASGFK